jgi:3-oxoacyl-[acyl-carrier-protein] synthase-3
MNGAILGVGHHVPSRVVTNDDLAKMFTTSDEWIVQRSGIRERRYVEEDGIGASDLAVPAAKKALESAGLEAKDLDCIVFATLSPDHMFPGSACFLQRKLGLPGIAVLDVRNQCTGFLYSLSIADAWIRAGQFRRVLVVGAEVHSTGLEFAERGRDVTVLFGDGAGAVVVGPNDEPGRGVLSTHLHADGSGAEDLWCEVCASKYMPRITHEMLEEGRQYPKMNGKQVFRWACEKMPEVAHEALAKHGLSIADVDLVIPHQANLRINEMVMSRLGVPPEKVYNNIMRYGNTTAASIPLCLSEAMAEGKAKKGDLILMVAFGAGFTWGSALVRL